MKRQNKTDLWTLAKYINICIARHVCSKRSAKRIFKLIQSRTYLNDSRHVWSVALLRDTLVVRSLEIVITLHDEFPGGVLGLFFAGYVPAGLSEPLPHL